MAVLALYTILAAVKFLSVTCDPVIIASSPNLMRVGNQETVLVSLHNRDGLDLPVDVTVKLKLFENEEEGVISESVVSVGQVAAYAVLYVDPAIIPVVETEEEVQRYVYVTVSCPAVGFDETKEVLLSYEEGFLFIQTDKPVYTPNQRVKIRVISLDQYLTPSPQEVQLDIMTPQDVIVRRNNFEEDVMRNGILSNTFEFNQEPMFGHWKIVAHYGKDLRVNRTVEFEVKEYVLPTYSVKIFPPVYILPNAEDITIGVESRYVYGKAVSGRCFIKVGIQEEGHEPVIIHTQGELLEEGETQIQMETNLLGENWFEDNVDNSLYIEVTVVEDSTGHFENASDTSAKFVRSPYTFTRERTVRYFKKGLPFEVKTDLKFSNGKPAPGVRVRVIAAASIHGQEGEVFLRGAQRTAGDPGEGLAPTEDDTNDKGQVNFRLYVPRQCTRIRISLVTDVDDLRGDNDIDNNARLEFEVDPYESPSGKEFLVLRIPTQAIRPNRDKLDVDVFLNSETAAPVINFFVVARGKLMENGSKPIANVDGFSIDVSFEMVPSARIVAYYISDDGNIIADSIWMAIERECENPLGLDVNDIHGEAILDGFINPQSQILLRVRGTPGTSVALLAVDQAVLLLRDYHRLTPDKMYGSMDEHDTGCGPGGGRNSEDIFMNAGLTVLTNLNLDVPRRGGPICAVSVENNRRKRSPGEGQIELQQQLELEGTDDEVKWFACEIGHRPVRGITCEERISAFRSRVRNRYGNIIRSKSNRNQYLRELAAVFLRCCRRAREVEEGENLRSGGVDLTDAKFITTKPCEVQIRNDFRESWAFDIIDIPEERPGGRPAAEQIYSVPGSITTWSLQAFGLHDNQAMCVLNPVDLLVFQKVFIQLHLPYSVVRKEFVEIRATIFNYHDDALVVKTFVEVPEELCSESIPGDLTPQPVFTVKGHDAYTFTFMIVGLETGEFPIKVVALTPVGSDVVVKMLRVEPEGVVRTLQHSTILNPTGARVDRQHNVEEESDFMECNGIQMVNDGTQRTCLDIALPPTAVPDSASCFVSITGNPLGPILTSVISGLESWIRLPSGCGEQTMIRLAPNVYVYRYLVNTESGTDADKAQALSNIESGVTRELTYRHDDGSYSAWVSRPSSTWLTAFVGKVFCQASDYIFVHTDSSCGAIKWLMGVQRHDGAFIEGLAVIHREMTGGVQGDAAMTAFALIAMKECGCVTQFPALATSASRATVFLEGQLNTLQRPYVVAIVTYALALAGSSRRFQANDMLKGLAHYDRAKDIRFWGTDASSLDPSSRPYWYQRRPSAISVETTGYALLAQLALNEISYSHPIVKWLSQQQNYGGGFVSTQDTVIALQALSEYATGNTGGNLDMYCNVTAPEKFETVLRLQEGDALVRRTQMLPPKSIKGKLMIKTGGEGVGQLNVEVRYNDLSMNEDAECRFNLVVTSERIGGRQETPYSKDDRIRVEVCASYLGEEQTSMAILDVGLFTGFAPVSETLKNLVNGDSLVSRTEVSGRSVIIYADHIPVEEDGPLCFEFEAVCEIVVKNQHHASVHVYDYYDPAEECTKFYAPEGTSLLGTLCTNDGMCACVSSKCAACRGPPGETTDHLLEVACATAQTYAYKIEVREIVQHGGFNITEAIMERIIKRGDDHDIFENVQRKFWLSGSCNCPDMRVGRKYLVIGRNVLEYEDEEGERGYKYIIDRTTIVRWWRQGRRHQQRVAHLEETAQRILEGRSNCG